MYINLNKYMFFVKIQLTKAFWSIKVLWLNLYLEVHATDQFSVYVHTELGVSGNYGS